MQSRRSLPLALITSAILIGATFLDTRSLSAAPLSAAPFSAAVPSAAVPNTGQWALAAATDQGAILTVAGTGIAGQAADELSGPRAIAFDAAGNLYIADRENHRVQRVTFDNNGNPVSTTTVAGTVGVSGSGANQLFNPAGVSLDSNGTLYIADSYNHRVQRVTFDNNGVPNTPTTVAGGNNSGSDNDQLSSPYGVAINDAGQLFIADTGNHRIQNVTLDASGSPTGVTTIAGGNGRGNGVDQFNNPFSVVFKGNGDLYIADTFNHRIQMVAFDDNDVPETPITITQDDGSALLKHPHNIAFNGTNVLYISDTSNDRIQKVNLDAGTYPIPPTLVAGFNGVGTDADQLNDPSGIAFDTDGRLHISDRHNSRVQQLTFDEVDPTIAAIPSSTRVGLAKMIVFSCDDQGGAGIDTCTGMIDGQGVDSGDLLNTDHRGSSTLTVIATDKHGNTTTKSITLVINGKRELTDSYTEIEGRPGSIARLYMATFTRNPESEGFNFWQLSLSADVSLQAIADYFVTGPEFAGLYGATTNSEFVDLMYLNTMGRTADSEGRTFWLNELDTGMTQPRMLLLFSESPEFKTMTHTS